MKYDFSPEENEMREQIINEKKKSITKHYYLIFTIKKKFQTRSRRLLSILLC